MGGAVHGGVHGRRHGRASTWPRHCGSSSSGASRSSSPCRRCCWPWPTGRTSASSTGAACGWSWSAPHRPPPELARRFTQLTGVKVGARSYGLTEAGPVTHLNPCTTTRCSPSTTGGLPCNDTEQKIVDLRTGDASSRWVKSARSSSRPQVMLGYWNAPESTAAALRNGWLYTGDIGRIDDQGYLTITDRKKEMIKYKGFGIAPAEIEALLFEHPGVADCAVIGKPDPEAGEVPRHSLSGRTPRSLRMRCWRGRAGGWPATRRSTRSRWSDAIPKTASGKILRRVLKEEERKRLGLSLSRPSRRSALARAPSARARRDPAGCQGWRAVSGSSKWLWPSPTTSRRSRPMRSSAAANSRDCRWNSGESFDA